MEQEKIKLNLSPEQKKYVHDLRRKISNSKTSREAKIHKNNLIYFLENEAEKTDTIDETQSSKKVRQVKYDDEEAKIGVIPPPSTHIGSRQTGSSLNGTRSSVPGRARKVGAARVARTSAGRRKTAGTKNVKNDRKTSKSN